MQLSRLFIDWNSDGSIGGGDIATSIGLGAANNDQGDEDGGELRPNKSEGADDKHREEYDENRGR